MLTLAEIEDAMDKARAGRDAARAEAERNTRLLAAYADQLQALTDLHVSTTRLVQLDPPALTLFDMALSRALPPVPPLPPMPAPMPATTEPPSAGWKRRMRADAPEPGPDSRAGKVLTWLRSNWREEGHTNPEVASGVIRPDAPGWVVSTQLSSLYHLGVLQRRVLVPPRPEGKYAYRALRVDA